MMLHYAVLYETRYGRAGVVQSFRTEAHATGALDAVRRAHKAKDGLGLVGYVGHFSDFQEAVNRALDMEMGRDYHGNDGA